MSYIVKSGTPSLRYTDPQATGSADPRGLYVWSAFYAPLTFISGIVAPAETSGEAVAPMAAVPSETSLESAGNAELKAKEVWLLLFTTDLPVIAQAYVRGVDQGRYNVQPIENLLTLPSPFIRNSPSGMAGPVSVANFGGVLKGYNDPLGPVDGVAVSGFAARLCDLVLSPLTDVVTITTSPAGVVDIDEIDSVSVLCVANGAIISSVIGPLFCSSASYASSNSSAIPIILRSNQYTQAIKDNNNLVVTENGNRGQVVGLYYVTPTPS